MEKPQVSHCCTADECLHQSVNQLNNNQKMAKLFFFPLLDTHSLHTLKVKEDTTWTMLQTVTEGNTTSEMDAVEVSKVVRVVEYK